MANRVVLGRRDETTFVGFQWSGTEPEGMNEPEHAVALGATWEGNELVCYNIDHLVHRFAHEADGFMEDPD